MGSRTGWPWFSRRELYSWFDLCFILANSAVLHIYLFISNHQSYTSSFPFRSIFFYKNSVTLMAYTSQQVWRDQCIIKGFQCKYYHCLVQRWAWMWCFQESLWHFSKRNMVVSLRGSVQTKNPQRNQKRQVFIALGVQNTVCSIVLQLSMNQQVSLHADCQQYF